MPVEAAMGGKDDIKRKDLSGEYAELRRGYGPIKESTERKPRRRRVGLGK